MGIVKRCIITGILGQDGSILAEMLHKKKYEIYGIVKPDSDQKRIKWIESLIPNITILPIDILSKSTLLSLIKSVRPTEIYNFAGITSLENPYDNLNEIFQVNARVPMDLLEIITTVDKSIKFFQSSSCLIFGNDTGEFQNESTPYNPKYPYGAAKLYAHNIVKEFREAHGIYACCGIFFNHGSERRPTNFFTRKITSSIAQIKNGNLDKIKVGNLSTLRDFGYAPDYMKAVMAMMNNSQPKDYVIGTGNLMSMMDFIKKCFEYVDLDHTKYIVEDKTLYRKNDTWVLRADASKIKEDLGWNPTTNVDNMLKKMIDYDLSLLK